MNLQKLRSQGGDVPLHVLSGKISASLSSDLRSKHKTRGVRVRKGDRVKIMRGDYKDIEGKVAKVNLKTGYLTVEGLTREKAKGENVPVKVHSSKVQVISLESTDKMRTKKVNKNG